MSISAQVEGFAGLQPWAEHALRIEKVHWRGDALAGVASAAVISIRPIMRCGTMLMPVTPRSTNACGKRLVKLARNAPLLSVRTEFAPEPY